MKYVNRFRVAPDSEVKLKDIEPESACKQLVDEANEAGGRDNITAIVARVEAI